MQCAWEWVCNGDLGTLLFEGTFLQDCISRNSKQQVMGGCTQIYTCWRHTAYNLPCSKGDGCCCIPMLCGNGSQLTCNYGGGRHERCVRTPTYWVDIGFFALIKLSSYGCTCG